MGLEMICVVILLSCAVTAASTVQALEDQSGCQRKCGETDIPYPFGLGKPECYKDSLFEVFCNTTFNPPKLIYGTNIPILNISIFESTMIVEMSTAKTCYASTGSTWTKIWISIGQFTFSNTQNKFTAIGCDTQGIISDQQADIFTTGCLSTCNNRTIINDPVNLPEEVKSCSGIGCCRTEIPKGLRTLNISLSTVNNHAGLYDSNPCDFAYLSRINSTPYNTSENELHSEAVIDWFIGNKTCEDTKISGGGDYICGPNSICSNSSNGPGYRCSCEDGFQGNPYTQMGCIDINECLPDFGEKYRCEGTCKNTKGNYTCNCPFGKKGDGKVGCTLRTDTTVALALVAGFLLAAAIFSVFWLYKKREQQRNHQKNGGLLLDKLSVKSFKEKQLEKATNNFDAQRLLGEGGNGGVYKGSLSDMTEIAVKKSKVVNQNQIEQFLNEADIVSKINHKNVVKLLGVCLESKVPMLVYELVSNGTLFQHIHGTHSRILDSWRICLRIAAEAARALDYMHSLAYPPIIHRDIKSSNILLDVTYTAKVADFGASKLIRLDRAMAHTEGQGTMGYLDPEYLQTGELTTKSDVYAFGVVLMELLSKQKPLSRGINGEMISLVKVFTLAAESDQLYQVLKVAEATESETEHIHIVAELALKCVAMRGTHRPTMTEVVDVLNGLSKEYRSFSIEGSGDEVVSLLDDQEVMTTSVHFELE